MVALPGPVRADAVRFTLVKPPAGPRTITCVSSVSPREPVFMHRMVRLGELAQAIGLTAFAGGVAQPLLEEPHALRTAPVDGVAVSGAGGVGVLYVAKRRFGGPSPSFRQC